MKSIEKNWSCTMAFSDDCLVISDEIPVIVRSYSCCFRSRKDDCKDFTARKDHHLSIGASDDITWGCVKIIWSK